jgi:SET domain-containing protein
VELVSRHSWLSSKIEIRDAGIGGSGMFAVEAIREGEVVIRWGGIYVGREEAERACRNGKGTMQWDDDLFSVEDDGNDDPAYKINHSCNPNVWMEDAITVSAMRDIAAGEEVTADYALWEANEDCVSAWICGCGSSHCRGRVTGRDWRLPEMQARYRGHFSPLLNKRIPG